jgi:hypothetical protein
MVDDKQVRRSLWVGDLSVFESRLPYYGARRPSARFHVLIYARRSRGAAKPRPSEGQPRTAKKEVALAYNANKIKGIMAEWLMRGTVNTLFRGSIPLDTCN